MTGQPKKDRTTRLPRGLFTERAKRWAFVLAVAMTGAASISVARADEAQAKRLLRAMSDYLAAQKANRLQLAGQRFRQLILHHFLPSVRKA